MRITFQTSTAISLVGEMPVRKTGQAINPRIAKEAQQQRGEVRSTTRANLKAGGKRGRAAHLRVDDAVHREQRAGHRVR